MQHWPPRQHLSLGTKPERLSQSSGSPPSRLNKERAQVKNPNHRKCHLQPLTTSVSQTVLTPHPARAVHHRRSSFQVLTTPSLFCPAHVHRVSPMPFLLWPLFHLLSPHACSICPFAVALPDPEQRPPQDGSTPPTPPQTFSASPRAATTRIHDDAASAEQISDIERSTAGADAKSPSSSASRLT